jgi:VIT1/CCC1 family predicted Fe2+/Mn2+ transporter
MNGVRKAIGLLIIIFIGIPALIGIIWGVGLTRAVVSPEFLSEMPREIITKIPDLLQETLEAVDREDVIHDEEARKWVRAVADAETSPKELLERIGIMDWLKTELSQSLDDIGQILRGKISPRPVMLNMRPLKTALRHEGIDHYLKEILGKLPICTDDQTREWVEAVVEEKPFQHDTPPACQPPGLVKAVEILRAAWIEEVEDIPDEVELIEADEWDFYPHPGVNITHIVVSLTYLLFFIPAVILLVASLIGTSSGSGIIRWVGISTLIGGALAFGLSKLTGKMVQWGIGVGPIGYSYSDVDFPFEEVGEIFIEKMGDIILLVIDHLFSAVNTVAGTVCIVGVVLIALSYLVTRDTRDAQGSTGTGGTSAARAPDGTIGPGGPAGSSAASPTGNTGDTSESQPETGTRLEAGPQPPQLNASPGSREEK